MNVKATSKVELRVEMVDDDMMDWRITSEQVVGQIAPGKSVDKLSP